MVISIRQRRSRKRVKVVDQSKLYKRNSNDIIQWVDNDMLGIFEFTFDGGITVYNMYRDYPYKLTPEQKAIFDKENPFWADYFRDRTA